MNKRTWLVVGIFAFLATVYGWGWIQAYQLSSRYYTEASVNLQNRSYVLALKGTPSTSGSADYQGGYEQVVGVWRNAWAVPRPPMYYKALNGIHDIIYHRLTANDAQNIFQTYLNLDNTYLPGIMLVLGDKSAEEGNVADARQDYETVIQAFPQDASDVRTATLRLKKLKS